MILAWLIAEDDGAKSKVQALLSDQDQDLSVLKATLQGSLNSVEFSVRVQMLIRYLEQLTGLEESETDEQDEKDMLGTLIQFL